VLAPHGSVAIYANNGGDEFTLPIRPLMGPNARWQFVLLYTVTAAAKAEAVEDVTAALLDGAIGVGEAAGLPLHHYPLEQAAAAHAAVQDGITGKVLIDVVAPVA
jgi:NADPH:quinone reductase